jgi:sugar lactone lactonase YvrE
MAVTLFTTVVLATAAPASLKDETALDRLRTARACLAGHDLEGARLAFEDADRQLFGHAGSMSALASIATRRADSQAALHWLDQLAATGLTRNVEKDASFASLKNNAQFRSIATRLEANRNPIANATVAFRLSDPTLLAEDVVWDEPRKRFLISSVHEGKIIAVDMQGHATDFVPAGAKDVWSFYGLAIDPKHNRLWATTAAGPEFASFQLADSGRTALLGYELKTGKPVARFDLPVDGKRHVLGDLSVGANGAVYVSESIGGGVYRLAGPKAIALDTLVAPRLLGSPQMPVVTADGRALLVADYPQGIYVVDLPEGDAGHWIPKPHSLATTGLDGLYLYENRLIGIQNGTSPHRVLDMQLAPDSTQIVTWHVLEQASPEMGEPNHGVVVDRDFYFIGNSGWERVGDDGALKTPADAKAPVLLKLPLDQ